MLSGTVERLGDSDRHGVGGVVELPETTFHLGHKDQEGVAEGGQRFLAPGGSRGEDEVAGAIRAHRRKAAAFAGAPLDATG